MHVGNARLRTHRLPIRVGTSCGLALLCFLIGSKSLQNAAAEGDTRTISMHHMHTGEDITITYKREGRYDDAALEKLKYIMRKLTLVRTTHAIAAPRQKASLQADSTRGVLAR